MFEQWANKTSLEILPDCKPFSSGETTKTQLQSTRKYEKNCYASLPIVCVLIQHELRY